MQKQKLINYVEKLTKKKNKQLLGNGCEFGCLTFLSLTAGSLLVAIGIKERWASPLTMGFCILGCLLYELKDIPSRLNLCRPRRNFWILLIFLFSIAGILTFLSHLLLDLNDKTLDFSLNVTAGYFWGLLICIVFLDRLKIQIVKHFDK